MLVGQKRGDVLDLFEVRQVGGIGRELGTHAGVFEGAVDELLPVLLRAAPRHEAARVQLVEVSVLLGSQHHDLVASLPVPGVVDERHLVWRCLTRWSGQARGWEKQDAEGDEVSQENDHGLSMKAAQRYVF